MITPRRIVISVLLAICLVGIPFGFSLGRSDTAPIVYKDPAVRSLTPQPGDLALRQARIGVTLATPFTLAEASTDGMSIDGIGIPEDQLEIIPGLNQYFFTPGAGKDVSSLPPGRNCVQILIKRVIDPTDPGRSFSWCFNSQ